jgi:hypothetical protein
MAFEPTETLILEERPLPGMRVQKLIYALADQKEGPPKRAFQLDLDASAALSGGLAVDLGKVVLRVLRTFADELADILGSRLGAGDEDLTAGAGEI